jgi:hypothetical protein
MVECTSYGADDVPLFDSIPVVPSESYKKSTWTEHPLVDSLDDSSSSLRLPVEEGCLSAPPGEDGADRLKNGRGW